MLTRPVKKVRTPKLGRRVLVALRLTCGVLLLTQTGLFAGHFHAGTLTDSSSCAVCQLVRSDQDASIDVPALPSQGEAREYPVASPPDVAVPPPPLSSPLPRGPPSFA